MLLGFGVMIVLLVVVLRSLSFDPQPRLSVRNATDGQRLPTGRGPLPETGRVEPNLATDADDARQDTVPDQLVDARATDLPARRDLSDR
jgi:hypothetical protein